MQDYRPHKIEPKWQEKWEEAGPFQAQDLDEEKPKFYALVEFPYPSGEGLHMGHAFTCTIMDILARKKRMEGFNVLHPMGWDAFGLPTENYAIRTGIHPRVATERNTKKFREEMKRLALSYNWEREINTTDPAYYRWTQWIFLQLFKHGLAYKEKKPINWCPSCKIGLANEEVVDGKCERCGAEVTKKELSQWLLRITAYADRLADELELVDFPESVKAAQRNWIGRTEGVIIDYPVVGGDKTLSCYSTRPDTNFGATFVVIAPEHSEVLELTEDDRLEEVKEYIGEAQRKSELERTELEKEKTGVFTGSFCLNRLTGRKMPIWVADFVVPTAGTGVVVGVPAHDQRDFDFAKKYDLDIVPVIKPREGDWDFEEEAYTEKENSVVVNSRFLNGLEVEEAIRKIGDYLVEKGWGRRAVNYHLRDWIFSRQHYWGEPIPMVYCEKCAEKGISWFDLPEAEDYRRKNAKWKMPNGKSTQGPVGWFPVPEGDLPVELPEVKEYHPTDTGESPLAAVEDWVETKCPHCGGKARRETDTMPNWAGSSWYYLAYTFWHKLGTQNSKLKTQKPKTGSVFFKYRDSVDYWMPVDLYLGGAEHTTLHLLYSRFWHKFLNDIGAAPYKEPYLRRREHGVILGEDGRRMSKSRGNVINPGEIIEKIGVDALRLYLMFMGPYCETMPWDSQGAQGCSRFLGRVWKAVGQLDSWSAGQQKKESDEELERELHRLIRKVGEDIEEMKFNTAIAAMMEFINSWSARQPDSLSAEDGGRFLRLLAPFAPHITEELWQKICENPEENPRESEFSSIHTQPWPEYDPKLVKREEITIAVQVNGKLRGTFRAEPGLTENEAQERAEALDKVKNHLSGKDIERVIWIEDRLLNFVVC